MHKYFSKKKGKTLLFFPPWLMAHLHKAEELTTKCPELAPSLLGFVSPVFSHQAHHAMLSTAVQRLEGTQSWETRPWMDGDGRREPYCMSGIPGYAYSALCGRADNTALNAALARLCSFWWISVSLLSLRKFGGEHIYTLFPCHNEVSFREDKDEFCSLSG